MKGAVTILILLLAIKINAQTLSYEPYKAEIINAKGNKMLNPFMGGLNSVYLNKADLNKDGKQDIVVFDFTTDKIYTFLNTGGTNSIQYVYTPALEKNFPQAYNYLILKDYNCDNIPDLFHKGISGVNVSKGYYQNNELKFQFVKALWTTGANSANVYVNSADIPIIEDMDGDGDLDIISMHVVSPYMNFYKCNKNDRGLNCDSLDYTEVVGCYGKLLQSSFFRAWEANISCKGGVNASVAGAQLTDSDYIDILTGGPVTPITKKKGLRHGSNALTAFNADGDGDIDIIGGNSIYLDLQFLERTINAPATFVNNDTTYKNIYMGPYPAMQYLDVNNDGAKDLCISARLERKFASYAPNNVITYFMNTGTTLNPTYTLSTINPLFDDMVDVGANSHPTLYDYDKDGKLDLFIGSTGSFDTTKSTSSAKITYFKNISTLGNIKFEFVTDDFLNLSASKIFGLYPVFGNITGSSAKDLVLGSEEGKIYYLENMATDDNTAPLYTTTLKQFGAYNLGGYVAPAFFDINKDNMEDLIVADYNGLVYHALKNSNTAIGFDSLIQIPNLKVGDASGYAYAAPYAGIVDTNNTVELVLGNSDGFLERYNDFTFSNGVVNNYNKKDSMFSFIQTETRSAPTFGDLDGDGKIELLIGNKLGGLKIYTQLNSGAVNIKSITANKINIYPNPSNNILNIDLENLDNVQLYIYNNVGQLLQQEVLNKKNNQINISNLPYGVYSYKIVDNENAKKGLFIKN